MAGRVRGWEAAGRAGTAMVPAGRPRRGRVGTARPGCGGVRAGEGQGRPRPVQAGPPARGEGSRAHGRSGGLLSGLCRKFAVGARSPPRRRCLRSRRAVRFSVVNAVCPSVRAGVRGCSVTSLVRLNSCVPASVPYVVACNAVPEHAAYIIILEIYKKTHQLISHEVTDESRTKKLLEAETM